MQNNIELLSPVGDFDCLRAAVQNGADCVYFGGSSFNARAQATNFDENSLVEAIRYAKLRNVKVNFTLNILLKDEELEDAKKLAKTVYEAGADAIIVQDLGFAKYLIDTYPDMDIHASTQMTVHNLQGALQLQQYGFKRVVLSRELSLHDIEYICNNSNIEIETFVHGALCISYSGQCLFSSMIGARSGNRGKCAQPCRLPYSLIEKHSDSSNVIDKGYLLSPRDLCSLEYIPSLIKAGVTSFKIEGRMKTPEYVATVTRIYRKYIDLALSDKPYKIDDSDIKDLMQVFNRGGFSHGNFDDEANTSYVFKEKQNNMGLYIGNISKYQPNRGLITFKTSESIEIGDNICVEKEDHKYTISELMIDKSNVKKANSGSIVTVGRLKGKINPGDKVYKLSNSSNNKAIYDFINKENIKIPLSCVVTVKKGFPLSMEVTSLDNENGSYFSMSAKHSIDLCPVDAISNPITANRIAEQINKTSDTPFSFKSIKIILDENCYIPKISAINQLRRDCLYSLTSQAISRFERKDNSSDIIEEDSSANSKPYSFPKVALLLNELNCDFDYSSLDNVDMIYIPLMYFKNKNYADIIHNLSSKGSIYIYLPTIIKDNYRNILLNDMDLIIKSFDVKGIVCSNIAYFELVDTYKGSLDIVANYTMNVYNHLTANFLNKSGISRVTISPELDLEHIKELASLDMHTELMVYGNVPVMNSGYCLLGHSNKCYPSCSMLCRNTINGYKYYLRDRLGYDFRIIPDNLQTITTIYNSKTLSIPFSDISIDCARISILDENIDEINTIINAVRNGEIFSGKNFTYGNLYKSV